MVLVVYGPASGDSFAAGWREAEQPDASWDTPEQPRATRKYTDRAALTRSHFSLPHHTLSARVKDELRVFNVKSESGFMTLLLSTGFS